MKQKLTVLLGLALLVLITGCNYLLYMKDQQRQQQLMQSQQAAQKQIADLNDRLVAVARQQADRTDPAATGHSAQPIDLSPSQQVQLTQQRNLLRQQQRQWTLTALNLAQDSLRQGNIKTAQQLLLQLQQNIIESQQDSGDIFNNTLLQTLKIDQLNLDQQATRQQQARSSLNQALLQMQQRLNLMAIQTPQSLQAQPPARKESGMSNWFGQLFVVERAGPETGRYLLNRSFIYKQASMNVAIARLALSQSDQLNFSRNINEALSQLYLLPDPASRQIARQLDKLGKQPWPASTELTSLTLLTGQKGLS